MTVNDTKLVIAAEPLPMAADLDGIVRISGTRVTLDTVVAAFDEGATAEEIAYQYPSLDLADVYAVIAYYLQHRPHVEAYLRQRQGQADEVRRQNEARFEAHGIRERLLAQRAGQWEGDRSH